MRRFAEFRLVYDHRPDETAILNFRHLPDLPMLAMALFADVNASD